MQLADAYDAAGKDYDVVIGALLGQLIGSDGREHNRLLDAA
jgi:hypothetical protein